MFGAHSSLIVFESIVRIFSAQEVQHLRRAQRSWMLIALVDCLRNMACLLFTLSVFVRIPLRDVVGEEIHHVLDVARYFSARDKSGLFQRRCSIHQSRSVHVKSGGANLPQDVMQMHHAACGTPFEDSHIITCTIKRHYHSFQDEFESCCAIPSHEQRILIYQFSALAFAQKLIILYLLDLAQNAIYLSVSVCMYIYV